MPCIANLGDANPIEHGGFFVFQNAVGDIYAKIIKPVDDGDVCEIHTDTAHLDKLYYTDGVLSDNEFHKDHPVWFAKDLDSICRSCDLDLGEFITDLCGDDPLKRGWCLRHLVWYFGSHEFGGGHGSVIPAEQEHPMWDAKLYRAFSKRVDKWLESSCAYKAERYA